MFGYKTVKEQLNEERKRSEKLTADLNQATADLLYVSMMTGVDLDDYGAPEMEVEENA